MPAFSAICFILSGGLLLGLGIACLLGWAEGQVENVVAAIEKRNNK